MISQAGGEGGGGGETLTDLPRTGVQKGTRREESRERQWVWRKALEKGAETRCEQHVSFFLAVPFLFSSFLPICMLSGLISAISFRRASVEGATSLSTPSISQSATPPPGSMTTVCLFFSRLGEQGTEAAWEGGLELTCLRDPSRCLAGFSKAAQLLSKYSFLMHATHTDHNVFT